MRPNEAIFVGDSPVEDIQGAKNVGLKTIFLPSQFNRLEDLQKVGDQPDLQSRKLVTLLGFSASFDPCIKKEVVFCFDAIFSSRKR